MKNPADLGRIKVTYPSLSRGFIEADEALDFLYFAIEDTRNRYSITEAMEGVVSVYEAGDDVVRYKIVTDLSELTCPGVVAFLANVLENDPIPLMRHEAAYGIGALGNPRDAKPLARALLEDDSEMVRHEAAVALAEIGGMDELPALETASNEDDETVALSAKFAIQSILLSLHQGQRVANG